MKHYLSREVHIQYHCYHNRCGGDANVLEASKVGCNTSVGKCTFNTATIIGAEEMQLCWRL